jgi:hypothetical protein
LHNAKLILEDNAPGLKAIIRFPRPPLLPRGAQRR